MSALAGLLREGGHSVTGSDENVYPPASTLLAELGIPVGTGYDPARLDGVDLVVCGNAVTRANPEAEAARARGVRMTSMPAAMEEMFLARRSPLVVAGTHGKTTSTAMLAWVLARLGRDPDAAPPPPPGRRAGRLRRLPASPRRRRPPTGTALRARRAERLARRGPGRRRRDPLHDPGARSCRVPRGAPAARGDQRPQR